MKKSFHCLLAVSLVVLSPIAALAQVDSGNEIPNVTRTYALVGARVVQAPGRVLERATVIIRDGLITAVAADATIPFDAEQIAADSFTVYAGFIDGLSHAGIPAPKEEQRPDRPEDPGYPPDEEAGILPGRDARTLLQADDKRIKDLRNTGFTAAHVVPRGRMLPGMGTLILLSDDDASELVYQGETSLFAQLASARRMYPGTDMAVIAAMRQLFNEARRRQRIEVLYNQDPTGLQRPSYDPTHYALFNVIDGELPVFFHTEDALDIHRALSLHNELGFPMVLTGLSQSFDVMEKLQAAGIPLLLTLELPEDKSEAKKNDKAASDSAAVTPTDTGGALPEAEQPAYDPQLRIIDYSNTEAEKKNLLARRDVERKRYLTNAGSLAAAGTSFGFTTWDTKAADLLSNIRLLIENGLKEDQALAALTVHPAEILGVSAAMGTVEAGKMGNLVVASGNIFEEGTRIRFVFVDGRKYEMESQPAPGGNSGDEAAIATGSWAYTVNTPEDEFTGTLVINDDLSGTISNDQTGEILDISDVAVKDEVLTFSFTVAGLGLVAVTVTIGGDTFDGEANSSAGSVSIMGTRTSDPSLMP